jgi:hypothetical protein
MRLDAENIKAEFLSSLADGIICAEDHIREVFGKGSLLLSADNTKERPVSMSITIALLNRPDLLCMPRLVLGAKDIVNCPSACTSTGRIIETALDIV